MYQINSLELELNESRVTYFKQQKPVNNVDFHNSETEKEYTNIDLHIMEHIISANEIKMN